MRNPLENTIEINRVINAGKNLIFHIGLPKIMTTFLQLELLLRISCVNFIDGPVFLSIYNRPIIPIGVLYCRPISFNLFLFFASSHYQIVFQDPQ